MAVELIKEGTLCTALTALTYILLSSNSRHAVVNLTEILIAVQPQATMSTQAQSTVDLDEAKTLGLHPRSILQEFFIQNEPAFRSLAAARKKVSPQLIFTKQVRLNNKTGLGERTRRQIFCTTTPRRRWYKE
jgi:hypothetical protein